MYLNFQHMQPEITLYMCVYGVDSASYDRKLKYVPYDLTEVWRKGVCKCYVSSRVTSDLGSSYLSAPPVEHGFLPWSHLLGHSICIPSKNKAERG